MACNRCCCRRTTVRNLNQNNFIPSAVEVFNSLTQTIAPNEQIVFLQTNYNTGVSFSTDTDNLGINIVETGVYKITFTGLAASDVDETISLAITLNGEQFPQSEVSQSLFANSTSIVSTTMVFKVQSPNANIGVKNIGASDFNLTNAKLDIVRIGNF